MMIIIKVPAVSLPLVLSSWRGVEDLSESAW